MTNIIIMAAGEQSRWENHLGVSKHMIEFAGEPLLHRTVRLFREHFNNDCRIIITAKDNSYNTPGAELYFPQFDESMDGLDKFMNTQPLWRHSCRNIIVYGDVFFTENAVKIIANSEKRDWCMFGRVNFSYITSKYGELFALSFYSEHFRKMVESMLELADMGYTKYGWCLYKHMEGFEQEPFYQYGKHFIEINDLTDDFDFPADYDHWIEFYNERKGHATVG